MNLFGGYSYSQKKRFLKVREQVRQDEQINQIVRTVQEMI